MRPVHYSKLDLSNGTRVTSSPVGMGAAQAPLLQAPFAGGVEHAIHLFNSPPFAASDFTQQRIVPACAPGVACSPGVTCHVNTSAKPPLADCAIPSSLHHNSTTRLQRPWHRAGLHLHMRHRLLQ